MPEPAQALSRPWAPPWPSALDGRSPLSREAGGGGGGQPTGPCLGLGLGSWMRFVWCSGHATAMARYGDPPTAGRPPPRRIHLPFVRLLPTRFLSFSSFPASTGVLSLVALLHHFPTESPSSLPRSFSLHLSYKHDLYSLAGFYLIKFASIYLSYQVSARDIETRAQPSIGRGMMRRATRMVCCYDVLLVPWWLR